MAPATIPTDIGRLLFDLSAELREAYLRMERDLSKLNADREWHLPVPATYVITQNGRIELAYVDPEYRNRLEPPDILRALEQRKASANQPT